MKLSLCITTMNRPELTMESFSKVYDHDLIDEIIIVEDHGDIYQFTQLFNEVKDLEKVKLFRNDENFGMSRNKAEAISKAKNEWCILFDSDNILYPEYLDSLLSLGILNPKIIYCPEFAEPDFDFSKLPEFITKDNAKENLNEKMFRVFLNCCNYVVNRDEYLRVYEYDISVKESDTIHFNYLWLKAGNEFYFVPEMKYFHLKHKDSGWLQNHKENIQKANEIIEKIKLL